MKSEIEVVVLLSLFFLYIDMTDKFEIRECVQLFDIHVRIFILKDCSIH
jgi:hypothetical protein